MIKTLLNHLPRYAEEKADFYSVTRESLIEALVLEHYINRQVAENTVMLIENLFDTLAVLNRDFLQKGEWCFVSFPAKLMAMSVLTALSDKNSRFFPSDFWETNGSDNYAKEQQRDVLSVFENRRVEYHASHNAPPIRYIYVAWGIIKLDNHILFYQREDTKKRFDKKSGDYGLIGGRLNQRDIAEFASDKKHGLQQLQSNNLAASKIVIGETLKRELHEEAGLIFEKHYTFNLWRSLKPYSQVQGSAPNHALTEYYFDIFHIQLTLDGYLFLQEKIKSDERLVLFSIADIEKGETQDGKLAYIKALVDDFDNDSLKLSAALNELSNSFVSDYLFKRDKYALTLLQNTDKPLFAGSLGKEKILDVVLTERQQQLLVALAAHNRGFAFNGLTENVVLQPQGWLELKNQTALQNELSELALLFQQTEFCIENKRDCFFRLSIEPSLVFFDNALFTYTVHQADLLSTQKNIQITLSRAAIKTPLGIVSDNVATFPISLKLANDLHDLSQHHYASDHPKAIKTQDNYRNSALAANSHFLAFGLKTLVRCENGMMLFNAVYQLIT